MVLSQAAGGQKGRPAASWFLSQPVEGHMGWLAPESPRDCRACLPRQQEEGGPGGVPTRLRLWCAKLII